MRNNTYLKSFATFLFAVVLGLSSSYGQITVTPTSTAAALATALTGPGVVISSPNLICAPLSNGTFTVTPGTLIGGAVTWGINSGVILSTGRAANASGTAATLASNNMSGSGDAALATLAGATTYDACILEFDITPTGDTIKFDYIFGSEEYNNSNCGPYNDAFAFFISGPGITGTQNMALVPGTTIPVTVNSVNSGVPGTGYTLANCTAMGPGSPFTAYYNDNTGGTFFTMKGFTKVFTALHDVIPCNTYHLKLTIADAGNSLYDSEVFLKQGSIVSSAITTTASVCQGADVTLTATPAGGTWSSASPATATVDPSTGIAHGVSAGTVNMTYTTGVGCYKITALTVTPPPTLTSGTSVCFSLSTTLTASPSGGTWSGGSSIATITAGGVLTGNSIGMAPITYTSPAGCVLATTASVFGLSPFTGVLDVCEGSTTALSHSSAGGTWTSASPSTATVGSSSGIVGGVAAGTSTITYSFGGSCYTTGVVTVNTRPAAPTVTPVHYCQFDGALPLGAAGANLLWYPSPSGGAGSITAPVPATTTAGTTTYYVTQTVGGCESPRVPIVVTVSTQPVFQITGAGFSCLNDTMMLSFTGGIPVGASFMWNLPPGINLLPGGVYTTPAISVTVDTNGTSIVHLHVVDPGTGCANDDTALITTDAPPSAEAYTNDNPCLGDTIRLGLSAHSSDAYTYIWMVDGVSLGTTSALTVVAHNSNSGGPFLISWNTTGTHIISIQTVANGGRCPSSVSYDTISVRRLPDAEFSFDTFRVVPCIYDSVYFAARTFNMANTYVWEPLHSFYNKGGHEAWGVLEAKQALITLTVTDPYGCKASSTRYINSQPCCRVDFPTAFTPNGDGKNDVFRPIFTDQGRTISGGKDLLYSYHNFHNLRIQNRWGQTVFESTNNYPVWDGTFSGEPQDMGVYYYFVSFDCDGQTIVQTGDVTLIR